MQDARGAGAWKKLPQRRLNMIDGTISSHCCVLNSPGRLKLIKEVNELVAVLGDIDTDKQADKEARKAAAVEKENEKKEKAAVKERLEACMLKEGMDQSLVLLQLIDDEGVELIQIMINPQLKNILRYYFNDNIYKRKGVKREELRVHLKRLYTK